MDRTPHILKLLEPHLPKLKPFGPLGPGGCELYLNRREYLLLRRMLNAAKKTGFGR
jgi:hypothetical protein